MATPRLFAFARIRGAFLVAAILLVAQTAAAAHELQHALHHHDNPSCAMHLFADHVGKAPSNVVAISLPRQLHDAPIARVPAFVPATTALRYYTRGPPRSS
jgi:hypothetical protein